MRTLFALILGCTILFLSSCKPDDSPDPVDVHTLRLDRGEFLSPYLLDGTFESAVRFTGNNLGDAAGGKLFEVEVYIFEIPQTLQVKIYSQSVVDSPATLVHTQNVTLGISPDSWNTIALTDSIDVPVGEDLWISMRYKQVLDQRIIGCDTGPAVENGDWIFDTAVGQWLTLRETTRNGTDINWNIRGKVAN